MISAANAANAVNAITSDGGALVSGVVLDGVVVRTDDFGMWAIVPGYNDELWVSSTGWVWQYDVRNKKWFKPSKNPPNSGTGDVFVGHRGKDLRVHVLVALAFFGPPPTEQHTVDHLTKHGGDIIKERSDNRIENLRWATKHEQALNRNKQKRRRDGRPVLAWRVGASSESAVPYPSTLAAANDLGINTGSISRCAHGGAECSAKGWRFRFAETAEPLRIADDEDFREVDGFWVSQYGRALDPQTRAFAFTPRILKGNMYAFIQHRPVQTKTSIRRSIHRLVAVGFPEIVGIPKPDQTVVDHKNRDRSDNRAANLKWATVAENNSNSTPNPGTQKAATAVELKSPGSNHWLRYASQCEAVAQTNTKFGVSLAQTTVSDSIKSHPNGRTIAKGKHKGWSIRKARLG